MSTISKVKELHTSSEELLAIVRKVNALNEVARKSFEEQVGHPSKEVLALMGDIIDNIDDARDEL